MESNNIEDRSPGADQPSPQPITERFSEEAVTDRFEPSSITDAIPDARASAVVALSAGELVDDRFRVEEGPLGMPTSEADVFRCTDTQTGEVVALKLYKENVSPKQDILNALMNVRHPDIITLRAHGTWAGHFYEVMDYCAGGSLADYMPVEEAEARSWLVEIINGLHYLHGQGIIHRDIKPNNIFFRKPNKEDLVIGDFGVSSILESNEKVRRTSTGTFFTFDYAAPELIDGKEVSAKTDYYALGITLIHLVQGESPFAGMDKNAALGCHFRGNVPRPKVASEEFRKLLNGLLRVVPESRWGYRQIVDWLEGRPILTDDGLPDRDDVYVGKRVPYRSLPEITTPIEMAQRVYDFDAARDLQRGYISQWAMFFDTGLGQRIARLEEEFADRPELAVFQLRYALDPTLPLQVGRFNVYSVAELMNLLLKHRDACRKQLEDLLYSGSIEVWVAALQDSDEARELARRIGEIRARVKHGPLGLFSLLYTLNPSLPLQFARGDAIATPEELEHVLGKGPHLTSRVTQCLYGGQFEEWLRCAFPHRKDDIWFVAQCVQAHADNTELGLLAVRCHFNPAIPFRLAGEDVHSPRELASHIDRDALSFERGMRLLANGWIRTWLACTGRMTNPKVFDEIVTDDTISLGRKMEAVLHILDPVLPWPRPVADVASIDAGAVSAESSKSVRVTISNAGRGFLSGIITLNNAGPAQSVQMAIKARAIEGESTVAEITLIGRGLPIGATEHGKIIVTTNGGVLEIPITFRATAPLMRMLLRSLGVGAVGGAMLGAFRYVIQFFMPQYAHQLIDWAYYGGITNGSDLWILIPFATSFLTVVAGLLYYAGITFYRREFREPTDKECQ